MQNLLSMILPAVSKPGAGQVPTHSSPDTEGLSELFGEWLQKFQEIGLGSGDTAEAGESSSALEGDSGFTVTEEVEHMLLEANEVILEQLESLELSDSVDLEMLALEILEVLGVAPHSDALSKVNATSSDVVAKVSEIVAQQINPEILSKLRELSTEGVKPEVLQQKGQHSPQGLMEKVSKSVAPEVLAQLKESGVKGISDEKVARVDAATSKALAPDTSVATVPLKPSGEMAFEAPKVSPLTMEGGELEQALSKHVVHEGEGVEPVEGKVFSPAGQTPKVTLDSSVLTMNPIAPMKSESIETPASLQEVPLKQEAPTLRTAGDFTIRSVRHLLGSGEETIEVRLNPGSLGSLSIAVKTTGQSVEIIVTAASPMIREMLEVQLQGLAESLMKDGVEVSKVRVETQVTLQNDTSQPGSHQQSASSQHASRQSQRSQNGSGIHDNGDHGLGEHEDTEAAGTHHPDGDLNLYA